MTIKYIEIRAELSWRKIPDIPLIVLPLHASAGYGDVKRWIEENIQNIVYVMIDDDGDTHTSIQGFTIATKEILVVFSEEGDYTAFKLMFPEYCQRDIVAALPLKPDSKFVEIPDNHYWFWYMKDDSPWLELRNVKGADSVTAYGDVRSWIEENTNGKVFIQFGDCCSKKRSKNDARYDNRIIILFDDPKDYIAFKLVFPEHCRV